MIGVVLNPTGGRGAALHKWEEASALLGDFVLKQTLGPGHARVLAKELVEEGCSVVVAAGGDGTVNEVLNGLMDSDATLAVLPCGTGNDLARTLGIGTHISSAVKAIKSGRRVRVDVIRWTCESVTGYAINVCGCGFDAMVADRINKGFKWTSGTGAYYVGILSTLSSYKPLSVLIRMEGSEVRMEVMLCAVANATSYGGGLRIAPRASMEDGLLDVVAVGALTKIEFLRNFPRLLKGSHLNHSKVRHFKVPSVVIEAHEEAVFLRDGEVIRGKRMEFEVVPGAIEVVVGDEYHNWS